jgi:hypothetical protein
MEAAFSSETSVDFQLTTRRYIPDDGTIQKHRCENLKSYIYTIWAETQKESDHFEDLDINGRIMSKPVFKKEFRRELSNLSVSG